MENNIELIPEIDRDFLREKGLSFDIILDGNRLFLIIKNFSMPPSYSPREIDLLIIILAGYPNSGLDMFWTNPDVKLIDGNYPTTADVHEMHNGINWQRWSRHYIWRNGIDSLKNFYASIQNELAKGI